ncbi:MAG: PLP-dependent aminotransferase family protein [Candidatus Eisenbacteria bacterium]
MRIQLDRAGEMPLYRQLADHLRRGILSGNLAPQSRLPATRRLARDLGVNRITIESAYAELTAEGLVASRAGSGTFVLTPFPLPPRPSPSGADPARAPWPLWQEEAARRASRESPLREAGAPARRAARIDFGSGCGDPRLFPAEEFRKTVQMVMQRDGTAALDYGEHRGYAPLRETITHILASQGLPARPEDILITAGSQQALALVAQVLLEPGDTVLVESPTYAGALDLFRMRRLTIVGLATDGAGMRVAELETLLQLHHPKLIYTIPNFHNPTGTCLDGQRRRQLVALADRYNIPLLEDDFVGDLRYEGRAQPPLKALDPGGRVIYTSTFSKMLMPGVRVGFLLVEGPIYERLVECKRVSDLASSSLLQRALEAYVTVGRYHAHLRRACRVYGRRRDALLEEIGKHLPSGTDLESPRGGLFAWLRLPDDLTCARLSPPAGRQGVAFAPGPQFFAAGDAPSGGVAGAACLRLNFAANAEPDIREGVKRLGAAIREARRVSPRNTR